MLIVLEGVDGVGKSQLADSLSDRLGIPIFKPPGSPLEGQDISVSQAEDAITMAVLMHRGGDLIMDRFFPSEYAYGVAFNRPFDSDAVHRLDQQLSQVEHLCVLLEFDSEVDFAARQRDISREHWRSLHSAYRGFVADSPCNWLPLSATMPTWKILEHVMREVVDCRPSREQVYMEMARQAARRSTCLARRNGAVLLSSEWHVIATGYNGAPTGLPHQSTCPRLRQGLGSGGGLEQCTDVHSEENCLVQAALNGSTPKGGTMFTLMSPCSRCARMIVNANLARVVYEREYGDKGGIEMLRQAGIEVVQL